MWKTFIERLTETSVIDAWQGEVPVNEYGNVEVFQPWMLPKGTVHIRGLTSAVFSVQNQ